MHTGSKTLAALAILATCVGPSPARAAAPTEARVVF